MILLPALPEKWAHYSAWFFFFYHEVIFMFQCTVMVHEYRLFAADASKSGLLPTARGSGRIKRVQESGRPEGRERGHEA